MFALGRYFINEIFDAKLLKVAIAYNFYSTLALLALFVAIFAYILVDELVSIHHSCSSHETMSTLYIIIFFYYSVPSTRSP